jgi:hypothetical protein
VFLAGQRGQDYRGLDTPIGTLASLCDTRRRADDHLSFVAGISPNQRKALAERGVTSVASRGWLFPRSRRLNAAETPHGCESASRQAFKCKVERRGMSVADGLDAGLAWESFVRESLEQTGRESLEKALRDY